MILKVKFRHHPSHHFPPIQICRPVKYILIAYLKICTMRPLLTCVVILISQLAIAQYRYDNVAFKTVYWDDLCNSLKQSPEHLLLDVRSKGEYEDTSTTRSLNIGHLKGA